MIANIFIQKCISDSLPKSLLELILQLELKIIKNQKLFVIVIKNWYGLCYLVYEKKFYNEANTIATYLSVYLLEAYGNKVLTIFDLCNQDLVKSIMLLDR